MLTLIQLNSALSSINAALRIHQENREEMMKLDTENVLFNSLLDAKKQVEWSIQNLKHL